MRRLWDAYYGPGRIGKRLQLDKSFYGESIVNSKRIRIEDAPVVVKFKAAPRIGVDYAGDYWKNTPWRFTI
ncbi:hypothetical protein MASR2M117_03400 [Paludibacter sp.]